MNCKNWPAPDSMMIIIISHYHRQPYYHQLIAFTSIITMTILNLILPCWDPFALIKNGFFFILSQKWSFRPANMFEAKDFDEKIHPMSKFISCPSNNVFRQPHLEDGTYAVWCEITLTMIKLALNTFLHYTQMSLLQTLEIKKILTLYYLEIECHYDTSMIY